MDCIWTSNKAGVTIKYVAPCDFKNQSTLDSILNKIVSVINRQDTSLQIWVLINQEQLSFPDATFSNFFSIGYDTLIEIDNDYIFDYYWNQETIASEKNNGLNTFRSREAPIDISSTKKKNAYKAIGIKIIYNIDYRLGKLIWADLIKVIIYSAQNPSIIKNQQRRDTVRYNTNGWYVSLLTIDTFAINKIIGRENQTSKKETIQELPKSKNNYWLFGLLGLAAIGVVIYVARQYSR
ncbi:hypothetical protein GCM10027043_52980 [Ferruginibacter profundus]